MQLISKPEVLRMTTFSHAGLYRSIKAGTFPKPIQIGPRRVAWDADDLGRWIESKRQQKSV